LPPARIPPEALHPPRNPNVLAWAAGISAAIHLVVLTIHFAPPDLKRLFDRGPPIEVALVNAKTKDKPQKADILAQANLDGGGNTDATAARRRRCRCCRRKARARTSRSRPSACRRSRSRRRSS
jgi:protein TonB